MSLQGYCFSTLKGPQIEKDKCCTDFQKGQEKQFRKLQGNQLQFIPEKNHGTCPLGSHFWTCEAEGDQEEPA